MISSIVYHELAQATGHEAVRDAAQSHHRRVMDVFLRPDREVVLEWLRLDGSEVEPPEGTAVIPGHAIESMWFQMHIAREAGDAGTLDGAVAAIGRHLELGWDPEHGGLLLAVDAEGREEVGWKFADTKLWWPHTEALYATLLAYEHCGEPWCLEWHERVRDYSYAHFPVPEHGEWRQKLDRRGEPITDVVALPVKDPFHLPRALILCIEVLDRLTASQ
jgi:N-acylglucosamine 2-epimerase